MIDQIRNKKAPVAAGLAAVCVLTIALAPNLENKINQISQGQVLSETRRKTSDVKAAPELAAIAEKPELSAKAVLAYDVASESVLYSQNFDQEMPIASLTKIISSLVIMDSGKINNILTVAEEDTKIIGANLGLVIGEQILASELMKSMLIASNNDATLALARFSAGSVDRFVDLMNKKAASLGMHDTHFTDPIGLDFLDHYSTANDLKIALTAFIKNDFLSGLVKKTQADVYSVGNPVPRKIKTTNKLLLEDESIVGVKTGYTYEAKGNLIIRSLKNNADVVTIVLDSDDREGDTRKVLDWIYTVYRW